MLEAVVNVSEGRDDTVLARLADACRPALLDLHVDPDHNRSVFTLAGPDEAGAARGAHQLTLAAADLLDVSRHDGVHPRLGAIDVVPFVPLAGTGEEWAQAVAAARQYAVWCERQLALPSFLYGDADPQRRPLPEVRRDAFVRRFPDFGPMQPHPTLGAVAVGVRSTMIAVNCTLDANDLGVAMAIARAVRERDGGLPGVRALGFRLSSRDAVQVSMNLTDLEATGLEGACRAVEREAARLGRTVAHVELVGLMPVAELERCSPPFLAAHELGPDHTVETRLRSQGGAD